MKSTHVIMSVGCIALLIAGCSRTNFTSIQSPATPLIDTFESYTSIADVQTALRSSGVTWATIEDSHLPPGDRRPPFDILAIQCLITFISGTPESFSSTSLTTVL